MRCFVTGFVSSMSATAIAHPNVALIKYWGKRQVQTNLPAVGSLSVTLGALETRTTVEFDHTLSSDELVLNERKAPGESPRLTACLDALRMLAGDQRRARVRTSNDFPTGAGLASSASGYAALVTAAAADLGLDPGDARLLDIARIGSGSAPRSMFGGIVELRNAGESTVCKPVLGSADWPLRIVVAVTTEDEKDISSRDGMEQSRITSPYYESWVSTHEADLDRALEFVKQRDFLSLAELAEHSCLKMHGLMISTQPPLIYWSPTTLACIQAVRKMRAEGVPVFFTIDAGPQLKAICLPEAESQVAAVLADVPGVLRLISGGLGEGARLIDNG